MICPKCQAELTASSKFCNNCGVKLDRIEKETKNECPQCGNALKPAAKFCQACGTKLASANRDKEVRPIEGSRERNLRYIPLMALFFIALAAIFYLLAQTSQNPAPPKRAENTPASEAPDMSRMMPVFQKIDSLRTALEANPADTTALLVLGEMYEIAGKLEEARDYYNRYLQVIPGRTDIMLRVLGTLINEHEHDAEEKLLAEILQLKPNNPHTFMHIGDLYDNGGKVDKARDYYNRSLAILPDQVDIFMRFAGLHFKEKNYEAAEEQIAKVLAKQPNNPHALYNYALALHMHGEHEKAVEYWQKAIESDPSGEIGRLAREALASFENMKGSN